MADSNKYTAGGVFRRSAFILANKNSVMVIGTFKDNSLGDALLYELIINAMPEKILCHSVAVLVLWRQEQHLWLVFFHDRGRRFPVMLGGTVHVRCSFDFDKVARLIASKIGKQVYLPCLFKHVWGNLHIGFRCSHSNKNHLQK